MDISNTSNILIVLKNYINVDKVYLLTPYLKLMRNPAVCYALIVPNTPKISAQ